jgi:hypothetical protein
MKKLLVLIAMIAGIALYLFAADRDEKVVVTESVEMAEPDKETETEGKPAVRRSAIVAVSLSSDNPGKPVDSGVPVVMRVGVVSPRAVNILSVYPDEKPGEELKEISSLRIGEAGKPWWSEISLVRIEDGNEEGIDFEALTYGARESVRLGEGQGGSLNIAIPVSALTHGINSIVATLKHDGKTIRSRPVTLERATGILTPFKKDIYMVRYHLLANRPQEALGFAESAIAIEQDSEAPHGLMGQALERLGRDEEALDAYNRALARVSEKAYEPPTFYLKRVRDLEEKLYPRRKGGGRQ